MIKNFLFSKHKFLKVVSYIFLLLGFYISSIILYLKYDIVLSPDFEKYYQYFEKYSGSISFTDLEQGHVYFFINYVFLYVFSSISENLTLNELVNLSVHFVNSIIFLYGLIGLGKFLSKRFNSKNTYLVLFILCFLPSTFELRTTLKPEILAFSLIGWLLYYFEIYKNSEDKDVMFKIILSFSIIFSSKISIGFLIFLFFAIEIILFQKQLLKKTNLKYLFVLIIVFVALNLENYNFNNKYFFDVEHNENYNNKAELSFFTNINTDDLKNNPNRYFHNESFVSITLFDTFNDFFLIYWNSEYTELNKDRKEFFQIVKRPNQEPPLRIKFDKENYFFTFSGDFDERWDDPNYLDETRMRISFITSVIFYFLIIIFSIFKKRSRNMLLSPFLGMLIVSFSALGLFGTYNFDPLVGDSMKTFYYGYFIALAFAILASEIFSYENFKFVFILLMVILFLFFLGFPYSYTASIETDIIYKNSLLPTCELNGYLLKDIYNFDKDVRCDTLYNVNDMFIPLTKVRYIDIKLVNIPYINFIVLFSYLALHSKLLISRIFGGNKINV